MKKPQTDPYPVPVIPPEVRPFAEQSRLEKAIRNALYHSRHACELAARRIPDHLKSREYHHAAAGQDQYRQGAADFARWHECLALYEAEFRPTQPPAIPNPPVHD